jgi:cation-transporting P-type ATPase I
MVRRPLPPARDPTPWHALPTESALARLGSRLSGLSEGEVERRKPRGTPRARPAFELAARIGDELFNPLVPLLAAGAGVSAVIGSTADAVMIVSTLLLNASLSGVQRFRTERAVHALQPETLALARVRRETGDAKVLASTLVPGDVILLGPGDIIPADCRLLEAVGLEVDAASLTGESLPVSKAAEPSFQAQTADRSSMIYAGTAVVRGRATALVVFTGHATEALRSALGVRGRAEESGVEKRLREMMDLTLPIALLAGVGVLGTGLLRGRKLEELLSSAVSLAVASVPEGLPLLATAAQLAAAKRLSERGALVQNVRSLEALGRVDTVCLDKTGTVTEGEVTLFDLFGEDAQELLALAAFASESEASKGATDPIDRAIWERVEANGPRTDVAGREVEFPFEAARGFAGAAGMLGGRRVVVVKGTPEAIFALAGAIRSSDIERKLEEWTAEGLRVLGVGFREAQADETFSAERMGELRFAGLLAFHDPVRPSAKAAIASLRGAGLCPVLVTGDHPSTARSVAITLGIAADPRVITGAELQVMDEDELARRVGEVDVFARVVPAHKVRIVRALARIERTVAMVGDGANDAPAIRLSSVGVAMGRDASIAAQKAADIVILDSRIETLVDAIGEGRAMWDSVRDAVAILVGGNLGEIGFTLGAGLVSGRPPLTPRQLLLVNLFTDVAPATAIALRAPEARELSELLRAGPDASLGVQLTRDVGARAATTAFGAGLAWALASVIGDRKGVSTTALLALVGTQLGQTMTTADQSREVLLTNVATMLALGVLVQTPGLSGMFGCRPLGPVGWSIALGSSLSATMLSLYGPDLLEDSLEWLRKRGDQAGLTRVSQPALLGSLPVAARR